MSQSQSPVSAHAVRGMVGIDFFFIYHDFDKLYKLQLTFKYSNDFFDVIPSAYKIIISRALMVYIPTFNKIKNQQISKTEIAS